MREILFRGKVSNEVLGYEQNKPNGTWVYGFYRDKIGLPTISEFSFKYADYIDYEVDTNTIGQFIGKLDKNGNKIFDGDVVKFEHPSGDKYTGYICYEPNEVGYVIKLTDAYYIIGYIDEFYEIIGNIYDNPELLKEVEE